MSNTQAQQPFRTRYIAISTSVYDALKVIADIEGASCPDEIADLRLGLLLSNEAQIQWAIAERRKRMEQFREDYREQVKRATQQDELR